MHSFSDLSSFDALDAMLAADPALAAVAASEPARAAAAATSAPAALDAKNPLAGLLGDAAALFASPATAQPPAPSASSGGSGSAKLAVAADAADALVAGLLEGSLDLAALLGIDDPHQQQQQQQHAVPPAAAGDEVPSLIGAPAQQQQHGQFTFVAPPQQQQQTFVQFASQQQQPPQAQAFSLVHVPGVVDANGMPAAVLVPIQQPQQQQLHAFTPTHSAPVSPVFAPAGFSLASLSVQQPQPVPAKPSSPTLASPAAAAAAASLSAYHQHRLASAVSSPPSSLAVAAAPAAAAAAACKLTAAVSVTANPRARPGAKLVVPDEALAWPERLIKMDEPVQKKRKRVHPLSGDEAADAPADAAGDGTPLDDPEEEARRLKNTLSARRSRAKRAAKMEFLEQSVLDLTAANEQVRRELAEAHAKLAQANARLAAAGLPPV